MILVKGEKAAERTRNEVFKDNEKNLYDAIHFIEPKKIPVGIEIQAWPFAYSGKKYADFMDRPLEAASIYTKFLDDIHLDFFWARCGVPSNVRALNALGSRSYYIGSDGNTIGHNQADSFIMPESDYELFIEDPYGYIENVVVRERAPSLRKHKDEAYKDLLDSLKYVALHETMNSAILKHVDELGIASLSMTGPRFPVPLDMLFDSVRGIRNTLIDLRRIPDKVKAACDRIFEIDNKDIQSQIANYIGKEDELHCGNTVYHSACFLNPKQFDEYFFSYFKKAYTPLFEAGVRCYLKGEGAFIKTIDRYRDLPKSSMVLMLEADDPFEMFNVIGDWATLAAGMNVAMLKNGTKDQCIDYAKRCIDTFAPGGGFIFMTDRPLIGTNDADPQNVRDVYEFANSYQGS